jgi:TspO/MBR family
MSTTTRGPKTADATAADRLRQVTVTAAEVFCVIGTLVGVGVLGTPVEQSSGGALSADATRLAPAGPAFSIWSVIYLGLAAYTVWQWLPRQATSSRLRATGWLAAASMVLNAAWLLVTQQGWIWVSVVVIAMLALVLGVLAQRLADDPAGSTAERVVVDTTFGLYLGWVTVATCANVTAALVDSGLDPKPAIADLAAVLVLALATAVLAVVARRLRGDWAVAVAAAWGLAWIAVGRFTDEPSSAVTGSAAIVAAGMVIAVNGYVVRRAGTPAT